jgi:outer membrane protein assembly factor BamB
MSVLFMISMTVFASLIGCAPTAGTFNVESGSAPIEVSRADHKAPNGTLVNEDVVTLPAFSSVDMVDYDDSLKSLLIKYHSANDQTSNFLVCDLKSGRSLWSAKSSMTFAVRRASDLVLSDPTGSKLYDAETGIFIRVIEPYLFLLEDGRTLQLSREKFAMLDIRTGKKQWELPGHEWTGRREEYSHGDWFYVVADGLHALNLPNGTKWEYITPTSFKNVGKEVAKQAALACLAAFAGGYNTAQYNPDITMNMNSVPVVGDSTVFFAARDKVMSLNKETGRANWVTEVDPELESMLLLPISDGELALVGTGSRIVNSRLDKSDPPTIRIIRKRDGKVTGLYKMDRWTLAQGFGWTADRLFLLTPTELLVFQKDLKLIGIAGSKGEYGTFTHLLALGDTIVLRASKGLVGLSKESLAEVWFSYCETAPVEVTSEWMKPYQERLQVGWQSLLKGGNYWTLNEQRELVLYELRSGKSVLKLGMYGKNMKKVTGMNFVDFENNKVKLVSVETR